MIEIGINNITKDFGFKKVLNGADLEVMTKDRAAIVGKNGSGKTTIFNIITGSETADSGLVTIRKDASIGYLEQIPQLLESDTTVQQVLMKSFSHITRLEDQMRAIEAKMAYEKDDALDKLMNEYAALQNKFIALDGYSIVEEFNRVVSGFKISELLDREFNVLSGGQKTIIKLAATILEKPDILLLDEPTNHLDIETLQWFEAFLAKYDGTVIMISHDRYFLDKVASKTIFLDRGQCKCFNGNYSFFLKEQERILMEEFEHYKNQQKQIAAMREAIKRFRDWGARADNADMFKKAATLEKRIEKMELLDKPKEKIQIPLHFSGGRSGKDVLQVRGLDMILGDTILFEAACMDIYFGEKLCLMGNNGSGKTTLIKAILGQIPITGGTIRMSESAKTGYIPQEIRFSEDNDTILEAFRRDFVCTEGVARNILSKYFFIGDHVFKRIKALSGGEKVLLKLAMLVQNDVNFLILDEPTNHIDIDTREILEEALSDFKGTLLFVSHDRYFINKLSRRRVLIQDCRLVSNEE